MSTNGLQCKADPCHSDCAKESLHCDGIDSKRFTSNMENETASRFWLFGFWDLRRLGFEAFGLNSEFELSIAVFAKCGKYLLVLLRSERMNCFNECF